MQLIGMARLGRDAEIRTTAKGESVCSLSLAYNFGRKGDDGKKPSQWVDGALWGKLAEALAPYLTKGTSVCVTLDDVHNQTYEGKNGEATKLVGRITAIELVSSQQQAAPAPAPRQAPKPAPKSNTGFDDMNDDIPF